MKKGSAMPPLPLATASLPTTHHHRRAVSMELLEVFVRIQEFGSISAAARELSLSPSLATRKLAALELALQTQLFQRTTRSVRLTEAGRIALDWARKVLDGYSEVTDDLANIEGRPAGLIRVSMSEYAAAMFLPPFLAEFSLRYPAIRLAINTSDALVNPIERGYDVAVHSGRIPDSSLVGVQIRPVQRVLCASPAYLARRGRPMAPGDLAAHDCLVHSPTEPANWVFRQDEKLISQPIDPLLSIDSYMALWELARRGVGIVRISRNVIREDLRSGRLVELLPDYQSVFQSGALPGLWVLYPNRRLLHRTRVFVDALTQYLERVLK
jgi:LysR family transcriptional regulator, transcriptional activator for dmlA